MATSGSAFRAMIRRYFPWTKKLENLPVCWQNMFPMPKTVWGIRTLEFNIQEYDDYDEMIQALQDREIDMIFYTGRNP